MAKQLVVTPQTVVVMVVDEQPNADGRYPLFVRGPGYGVATTAQTYENAKAIAQQIVSERETKSHGRSP